MNQEENNTYEDIEFINSIDKIINIIFGVLCGFRLVAVICSLPLNYLGMDCSEIVRGNLIELIPMGVYYGLLKSGHKGILILPLLGSVRGFAMAMEAVSYAYGEVILTVLAAYFLLMVIVQFISFMYLLIHPKITFYCMYKKTLS